MKKVIGILVNDIHLNKENGELIKDIFNQLIVLCKKYETNRIFCGGDIFTNRSGQPLQCLTNWKEVLQNISTNSMELYVIPGNHDKTDSDDEKSYLDVYNERCFHLFRKGSCEIIDNVFFGFIPYYKDEKWLSEFKNIDSKRNKDLSILITHSGFDGVTNNDGSKVVSLIKPSLFKNWTKVLIGHYHNAEKLAENVYYTGSAYQNNFGENITDKGFTIIFDDCTTKFVPSNFPKYIKEIIDVNDKESLRNLIEKYDGEKYNHIRFIFTGNKLDCQKINISEIQGKFGIDCKFQSTEEINAIEVSESDTVFSYDKKQIMKDFLNFCTENEIKGLNLSFGLDLIKNIKNVEPNKN